MTEPRETNSLSYSSKSLVQRWTSLGVTAIASALLGVIFLLLIAGDRAGLLPTPFRDGTVLALGLLYLATLTVSTVLGIVAMIAGSADNGSQKDAKLGFTAMFINGLPL